MFKNIMLPLDGSHFSELALPLSIDVARSSGARLHLVRVHVPALTTADVAVTECYDMLVRQWESDAQATAVSRVRDAGVEVVGELLSGPVVTMLQQYVRDANIDLVIMTTHGRSGIRRAVLGSVAEQCVRRTEVPILLLRAQTAQENVASDVADIRRILVTLDGSIESEAVVEHATLLARATGAELILARVAAAPFDVAITIGADALREYLERLTAQAIAYLEKVAEDMPDDLRIRTIAVCANSATEGIMRCAQEQHVDLIAMATHGRSGWARVAVGSVAETVLHRSATPVMLVKGVTSRTSADLHSVRIEPAHSGGSGQASP